MESRKDLVRDVAPSTASPESPGDWISPDSLGLAFSLSAAEGLFTPGFVAGVTFARTETVGGGTP